MKVWILLSLSVLMLGCGEKTEVQKQVELKVLDGYQCLNGVDDTRRMSCSVCKKDNNVVIYPKTLKACSAGSIYRHTVE